MLISELTVPTVTLTAGISVWVLDRASVSLSRTEHLESSFMAGFPGSCSTDILAEAAKHCSGISLCLGLSFSTCDITFLCLGLSPPIPCALRWEEAVGSAAPPAVIHA